MGNKVAAGPNRDADKGHAGDANSGPESLEKVPGYFYAMLKLFGLRLFASTAIFLVLAAFTVGLYTPADATVTTKNLVCCAIALVGFGFGLTCAILESRTFERVVLKVEKKFTSSGSRSSSLSHYLQTELGLSWVTRFLAQSVENNSSYEFGMTKRTLPFRILYWGDVDLWGPARQLDSIE